MQIQTPYSASAAAKYLGVSKWTVVRWLKTGLIPGYKVGFGVRAEWRIDLPILENIKKHNGTAQ